MGTGITENSKTLREMDTRFRGNTVPVNLKDKTVIVIDDELPPVIH